MAVLGIFREFLRVREEASFNAANPEIAQEWNIKDGTTGWHDIYAEIGGDPIQHHTPLIFSQGKSGSRSLNDGTPVVGAQPPELGTLTMAVYPELIDLFLRANMGTETFTETAGIAAKSIVVFASLATLDTQPTSDEQLKFVISASTAASGAAINVIQNAVTVETITIPDSGSSVDGDYYMIGNVADGSSNNVTFTITGTVTGGSVVVSGIKFIDINHKSGATEANLVVEQAGRVEEGAANSEFFPGVKTPTLNFAYERDTLDGLLMMTATVNGLQPTVAVSTTYGNHAALFYRPIAGWTGSVQFDDVANLEVVSANLTLESGTEHFNVSSGNQAPQGAIEGMQAFFGTITVKPSDTVRWDDYLAATKRKFELEFLTDFFVNAATPYRVKFTVNSLYPEDYTRNQQGAAQGAEIPVRGVFNTTDGGAVQIDTRGRLPV